jgi:hypothetical protein
MAGAGSSGERARGLGAFTVLSPRHLIDCSPRSWLVGQLCCLAPAAPRGPPASLVPGCPELNAVDPHSPPPHPLSHAFHVQLAKLSLRELADELLQRECASLLAFEHAAHPPRADKKEGKKKGRPPADLAPLQDVSAAGRCSADGPCQGRSCGGSWSQQISILPFTPVYPPHTPQHTRTHTHTAVCLPCSSPRTSWRRPPSCCAQRRSTCA